LKNFEFFLEIFKFFSKKMGEKNEIFF